MAVPFFNLAKMTVSGTPGTGTITLGSAATVNGVLYLTFAQSGVTNGAVVDYAILDTNNSEIGTGTYSSVGPTLTRTVTVSTNGNAAINATSAAIVSISPRAESLNDASLFTSGNVAIARLGLLPITKEFVSSNQTITSGGSLTLPHGLGALPKLVEARVICTTADLGYSVNDQVVINPSSSGQDLAAQGWGFSIVPDATNVFVRYGNAANVFLIGNKSTGAWSGVPTLANWRFVIRAYA